MVTCCQADDGIQNPVAGEHALKSALRRPARGTDRLGIAHDEAGQSGNSAR